MFWDIEDEQICKSILLEENNLDRLKINMAMNIYKKLLNIILI